MTSYVGGDRGRLAVNMAISDPDRERVERLARAHRLPLSEVIRRLILPSPDVNVCDRYAAVCPCGRTTVAEARDAS